MQYGNLYEVTRLDMIKAAKNQSPDRFMKKNNYTTRDFKNVNFKLLMEEDEFLVVLRVGDYVVSVDFDGPFEELKYLVKGMRGPNRIKRLTKTIVQEALNRALDTEDIYVSCSCPDFKYRMRYYATQKGYLFGSPKETRRPQYTKTNKDDNKGYVCKHILTALYGKRWVPYAANAWLEYMKANPELSEEYLWPDKRVRKPKDNVEVADDTDAIKNNDTSNDTSEKETTEGES